jgi:GntR family transcriptional regulator/MocR family aminotransferase
MRIPLDRSSRVPLFEQIASYLRERCGSGALPPGTRLPSARALAEDLGISRITVENAYADLEAEAVVERRPGSGTFVAEDQGKAGGREGEEALASWQAARVAEWAGAGKGMGAGFGERRRDTIIDLSSGFADPSLFPAADFRRAMREVLAAPGNDPFSYGPPAGFPPFRETVAGVLASRGIDAVADDILITAGTQEALTLSALLVARRGERVLVETPTYASALGLFRAFGLEVVGLPCDEGGVDLDALRRELIKGSVALIFVMPNFRNPTGTSMELSRRSGLVALAARHAVPILEDDYVGDLRFEGRDLPALAALGAPGSVLYAGTFSKMLAPGLRTGFLLARGPARARLLELKYCISITSSNIAQRALHAVVSVGSYERHLRRSRRVYRSRRDILLDELRRKLPRFSVASPAGGIFAWVGLPRGMSALRLAAVAERSQLLVFPGGACFPDPGDPAFDSCLRLSFATESDSRIAEAVARLAEAARCL